MYILVTAILAVLIAGPLLPQAGFAGQMPPGFVAYDELFLPGTTAFDWDPAGNLWLASNGGGALRFDDPVDATRLEAAVERLVARHPAGARRTYTPWFWLGIVSFFGAYAIWLTGTADHPWCSPDSIVQAHAIWHLLSAVATWCFFLVLRTERPLEPSGSDPAELSEASS